MARRPTSSSAVQPEQPHDAGIGIGDHRRLILAHGDEPWSHRVDAERLGLALKSGDAAGVQAEAVGRVDEMHPGGRARRGPRVEQAAAGAVGEGPVPGVHDGGLVVADDEPERRRRPFEGAQAAAPQLLRQGREQALDGDRADERVGVLRQQCGKPRVAVHRRSGHASVIGRAPVG
ncbi:hypothetical protein ACFPIJ_06675 [Dactylosporangium cerinum]|uniref:Uncharacterized protein n=1 Tax=Dactylosporangium cerinum TaxID=1434730 RepID=A0ABV9VPJ5_9ACTN